MNKAASIDAPRALAVFDDGKAHTPKDVAIACQVHSRTAAWFLSKMAERGILKRISPRMRDSSGRFATTDFGAFRRSANA